MKNEALENSLCAEYCAFYRPGKDEELACGGYLVVRRLAEQNGDLFPDGGHGPMSIETEDELFHSLCRACAFFDSDCDFASWKRGESPRTSREAVRPCGGFLFLGYSLVRGSIDIQTVHRAVPRITIKENVAQ